MQFIRKYSPHGETGAATIRFTPDSTGVISGGLDGTVYIQPMRRDWIYEPDMWYGPLVYHLNARSG